MKYYLAYGSNLSVDQMEWRCPDATYIGYGFLEDYRLLFRRGYLTVEPESGSKVPVLVWQVSKADEKALDYYEGWPRFYRKKDALIDVFSLTNGRSLGTVKAFIYVMNDGFSLQAPTVRYWDVCLEGYRKFGFDEKILEKALSDTSSNK